MKQFIFYLLFFPVAVFSVLPNPIDLTQKWWSNWEEITDVQKVAEWQESLDKNLENLSEANQETARRLIQKIESNIQTYLSLKETPLPKQEITVSFSSEYSLQDFQALKQRERKQESEKANIENRLSSIQELKKETLNSLDVFIIKYETLKERTEEKFILGLQIVSNRLELEILKLQEKQAKQELVLADEKTVLLSEEVEFAKQNLSSSVSETSEFQTLSQEAKIEWEKAREKLNQIQSKRHLVEGAEKEFYQGELLQARIEEIEANLQLIFQESAYQLAQLVSDPEQVDHLALRSRVILDQERVRKIGIELKTLEDQLKKFEARLVDKLGADPEMTQEMRARIEASIRSSRETLLNFGTYRTFIDRADYVLRLTNRLNAKFVGGLRGWFLIAWDQITRGYEDFREWLQKPLFHVGERPITLVICLQFLGILIATFWFAKLVRKAVSRFIQKRQGIDEAVAYRINSLLYYFLLGTGLIIAMTTLGFDTSKILLMLSALGVGLGFGLQNIFKNFVAGIIILFQSQLRVRDYIELESGVRGEIREINVLSTVVRTNDGSDVLIPNSEMIGSRLTNWTYLHNYRRLRVPFSVSYDTDKELVVKLVAEAAKELPLTLKRAGVPEPYARLTGFGDSGMEFELVVWVGGRSARHVRRSVSEYLWEIERVLKEAGISIPYPQREVRVLQDKDFK